MVTAGREEYVKRMFDEIATTYDTLNHLLSFGLDFRWRHRVVHAVTEKSGGRFLDLATGTGDLAMASVRAGPRHVVGIDFAFQTLLTAQKKIRARNKAAPGRGIDLVSGDAALLPFREKAFDAVLVGFGIRNFPDIPAALREMHRVLQTGGILCILELSRPHLPVFSQLFRLYFHHAVPLLGGLISGHTRAYRYLPESVDAFPAPDDFVSLMRGAGFREARFRPLTLGTAVLYAARR